MAAAGKRAQTLREVVAFRPDLGKVSDQIEFLMKLRYEGVCRLARVRSNVRPDFSKVSLSLGGYADREFCAANSLSPLRMISFGSKSPARPASISASPSAMSLRSARSST